MSPKKQLLEDKLNDRNKPARLIAFYLPQYHPISENDEWWGKGFTEWSNVGKARPLYRGHYQPKVPTDLGYYDLRVPETREQQAELAHEYGIEAFCYYHYWFAGNQLLERPFTEVVASGQPQFPFCVCWANETWTGIWHGAPNRVLIQQTYPGREDHVRHFRSLEPAFHDSRYVRVDGKPLFLIYKPKDLPDPQYTTDLWRELAAKSGLDDLFIVGVCAYLVGDSPLRTWVPQSDGFDASVSPGFFDVRSQRKLTPRRVLKGIGRRLGLTVAGPSIYSYEAISAKLVFDCATGFESFPCVVPNWDNTPRSGRRGVVFEGATPALYRRLLGRALQAVAPLPQQHRLVFLKSWNEWAEGNYLEPDLRFGHGFLQATRDALLAATSAELEQPVSMSAELNLG